MGESLQIDPWVYGNLVFRTLAIDKGICSISVKRTDNLTTCTNSAQLECNGECFYNFVVKLLSTLYTQLGSHKKKNTDLTTEKNL